MRLVLHLRARQSVCIREAVRLFLVSLFALSFESAAQTVMCGGEPQFARWRDEDAVYC